MWKSCRISALFIFHLYTVESSVIPSEGRRRDTSPHPSLTEQASPHPTIWLNTTRTNSNVSIITECGPVAEYYHATAANWSNSGTGDWFNSWWTQNQGNFNASGGFAPTFGDMYLGNPGWTCRDDGDSGDCAFSPCNQPVLNAAGSDIEPAYYVLQSVTNLHSYFQGLSQALQAAATDAALSNDDWAWTFYKDKNDVCKVGIKEIINIMTTAVAIVAAFAAPFASLIKIVSAASCATFAGGVNAAKYQLQQTLPDDTPLKAADIGAKLGAFFIQSLTDLISANDQLMAGQSYGDSGDLRTYISDGDYLGFQGIDKDKVIEKMSMMLMTTTINYLYKQQKIFIMGGGPCNDTGGIGSGPQEAKYCRDGKAWYIFFWKEYGGISFGKKQWGDVESPPGLDELGSGQYGNISVQDIISSSLDSYNVAGNNYTYDLYENRTKAALLSGALSPSDTGPAMEGTFTVAVCDVGPIVPIDWKVFPKKNVVLQPYGSGMVPQWCAPMCANSTGQLDKQTSLDFLAAAQMTNFRSPYMYCPPQFPSWVPW